MTLRVIVIDGDNLQRQAEVIFSTRDGTATSTDPRDYEDFGDSILLFDNTQRSRTVTIPIDDDDILEDTENFFGQLRTTENFVDLAPAQTEVVIFEMGDGKELEVHCIMHELHYGKYISYCTVA